MRRWNRLVLALLPLLASRVVLEAQSSPAGNQVEQDVAVINSKTFHQEILAGVLTVLRPLANCLTIYTHRDTFSGGPADFGFDALLGSHYEGRYRLLPTRSEMKNGSIPHHDFLIFVSPEYAPLFVHRLIRAAKPSRVVLLVHNADDYNLPHLSKMHHDVTLMALSPHVALSLKERLNSDTKVGWITPTASLRPQSQCRDVTAGNGSLCIAGFAMQGMLDTRRRNYSALWTDLQNSYNQSQVMQQDPRFRVHVLGSGAPGSLPQLQGAVRELVSIHCNLQFNDYYEVIHHTYALLPSFASPKYFRTKFSSTIATSLVTGVPLVATERMLKAYTFLDRSAVFIQHRGEPLSSVMLRILALPKDQVQATRAAVRRLRLKLNARAQAILLALIRGEDRMLQRLQPGIIPYRPRGGRAKLRGIVIHGMHHKPKLSQQQQQQQLQ